MQYVLKIYDKSHRKIARIVKADEFDLFYGTVETVVEIIDIEKVNNNFDVIKIVLNAKDEIINLLKDIFPDVSDEEWKCVKVKDIVAVLLQIIKSTVTGINLLSDEKN